MKRNTLHEREEYQAYKCKPVLVPDDQGNLLTIDALMECLFKPPLPYKKIFYRDGQHCVEFYTNNDVGKQFRYIPLAHFIYETHWQIDIHSGYEIVQEHPGFNYTIGNLISVRKPKEEGAA